MVVELRCVVGVDGEVMGKDCFKLVFVFENNVRKGLLLL